MLQCLLNCFKIAFLKFPNIPFWHHVVSFFPSDLYVRLSVCSAVPFVEMCCQNAFVMLMCCKVLNLTCLACSELVGRHAASILRPMSSTALPCWSTPLTLSAQEWWPLPTRKKMTISYSHLRYATVLIIRHFYRFIK